MPLTASGPIALLRARRDFRILTLGLCLSYIGSGAATTALVLYVQASAGTGVAVGALLLAQSLPRLAGPLAGALVDRTELRRLMIACDLGGAVVFGLLALLPPLGITLALAAAATALQAPYSPARSTMIANLVEPAEVGTAYAIENTTFNLQVAIGPVIGGVLVAAGGADLALTIDALTFAASAAIVSRVRSRRAAVAETRGSLVAETREGITYALRHPVARALTISLLVAVSFLALDDVALPFLVRDTLGGGPAAYGLAFGAFGIGMLAASLALAFRPRRSPAGVYLTGLAVSGAGGIATGAAPGVGAAVAFQAGAGVGNGLENVASNTLIQRHVAPAMLGRVFGLVGTAAYAGSGIAALIGGLYLDATSPRVVLITGGAGGLLALALALRPLLRAERRVASPRSEGGEGEGG